MTNGGTIPPKPGNGLLGGDFSHSPTIPMPNPSGSNNTVVFDNKMGKPHKPRMVGLLITFSRTPAGEVFKVYEGRTTIGRDELCNISFPEDRNMSSNHLLIQYVEAKGAFRAQEYGQGSANGTYVNGQVYVLGDVIDLKNNDVIILGSTKFVFLTIPSIIFNSPDIQL